MFKVNGVESNQREIHADLLKSVTKHKNTDFKRPFAEHSLEAFERFSDKAASFNGDVIIDACCGVGESTYALATRHPKSLVVGIDKSLVRLEKHQHYKLRSIQQPENVALFRADLNDFWRLLADATCAGQLRIKKQYILYPNPYPKKSQLNKRWYAGPIMTSIISACSTIECRSNWLLYLQEFKEALTFYGIDAEISQVEDAPITPFERKYIAAGQTCWKLTTLPL